VFLIRLDRMLFMTLLVPMKQESEMLIVVLPFSFHVLEGMVCEAEQFAKT